ncbi:MAG TPA: DUF4397 domain-containing protein [Puia sp.]|nr:DUF4397 domain-containing protein [Puia sp.]
MRKRANRRQRAQLSVIGKVFFSILIIGGLAACAKSASSSTSNTNLLTYMSVMNVAPYSSPAQLFLNGQQATGSVGPGSFSNSYAHLTPGSYDVKFKVYGADSTLAALPASNYDSMGFYTLILYNDSIHGPAEALKITDDFSTISLSSSFLRFFHMCLELPAVDLYLNGTPVIQNRVAKDIVPNETLTKFQPIASGFYNLQIKKAGTDSVIGNLNSVTLQSGNAYTIFLSGSATNSQNPISLNIVQAVY